MTRTTLLAASAAAALFAVPAAAQHQHHAPPSPIPAPAPAPHDQGAMAHDQSRAPLTPAMPTDEPPSAPDHAAMDHSAMGHGSTATAMSMMMGMGRDDYLTGSGTARLPYLEAPMRGTMVHAGAWMLMAHGYAWGVYDDQGGRRGDDMAFITSMAMLMGDRDIPGPWGDRVHVQLRAMGSLEPAMGARGYPNIFAVGEVANNRPLVDRQHPHDLFMELSARVDYRLGGGDSLFLYGGPVAEPALGPSAFVHRASARYLPLAPITHHWFDSSHITYGVVTGGYAAPRWQIEASAFRGREPDERRWNIEAPKFDSWSVRASWTPSPALAMQVSHGRLKSPEEFHPDEDEARTTASIHYATGPVTTTFAYSRKDRLPGPVLPAWLAEASWEIDARHAVFGRLEHVRADELFPDEDDPLHDRLFDVTKLEAGYAYRLPILGPLGVALGGTVAGYLKPDALDAAYGRNPVSWTLFSKLVLGL
ncbi:MAG TPA: hypothetical protein VF592_00685 [Sphingomonas sp.]|jgi:hypothetical protein|uniref:hypothetical protein n=1 Tax=Sphingomonas sp. TaxID=28214 RepID=UPI002ED7A327